MLYRKLIISSFFLLSLCLIGLQAQEAIPAAGGEASSAGGSVSYSVGQIFYSIITGSDGTVIQGVQQPYEISVISGLSVDKGINLMISAFPNPAIDFLILKVENPEGKKLIYHLYDVQGKLLETKQLTDTQTQIQMKNLVPAIYFLKVKQGNSELKTFKVIKN